MHCQAQWLNILHTFKDDTLDRKKDTLERKKDAGKKQKVKEMKQSGKVCYKQALQSCFLFVFFFAAINAFIFLLLCIVQVRHFLMLGVLYIYMYFSFTVPSLFIGWICLPLSVFFLENFRNKSYIL